MKRTSLVVVGGSRYRIEPEPRMVFASQAIFAGPQDITVRAMTPQASGRGYGHLCLRVGRVLVYLEDRDALAAWHAALEQAEVLAGAAFGPELPPAVYEPRSSQG